MAARTLRLGSLLSLLVFLCGPGAPALAADPVGFDVQFLKNYGLDSSLNDYFKDAPRFPSGPNTVDMVVNGQARGRQQVSITADGKLCFQASLLTHLGLVNPAPVAETPDTQLSSVQEPCIDYLAVFPSTIVRMKPSHQVVELTVSTDALSPTSNDVATDAARGGTAALLNYDALAMRSSGGGNQNQFFQLSTELGFNSADWLLRSRQFIMSQGGKTRVEYLGTYGQRTLTDYRSVLQIGQIGVSSPFFSSPMITGVQIMPETALASGVSGLPMVEGIAQTEARVEVRQNRTLIFSTAVPPGPFALSDLPLINQNSDLEVTVVEANNVRRTFVVPAASLLRAGSLERPGYSFALGKVYGRDGGSSEPWMATGSGTWALGKRVSLLGGALASSSYVGLGGGVSARLFNETTSAVRLTYSHDTLARLQGVRLTADVASPLLWRINASVGTTVQSPGFRDFATSISAFGTDWWSSNQQRQFYGSLSWSDGAMGSFSMGYSLAARGDGVLAKRITASWGRSFGPLSVSVNLQRQLYSANSGQSETILFANIGIPLGTGYASTRYQQTEGSQHVTQQWSDKLGDRTSYVLSAGTDFAQGQSDGSASVNMLSNVAQVNATYARNGAFQTYIAGANGGIVAHGRGVTFSPYPIRDTFGIASVDRVPGVKIETSAGPVWTDAWGRAVIASLPEYQPSRIELVPQSLPRNVDVSNGLKILNAGRGSVASLDFGVSTVRRVLFTVKMPDGFPLKEGAVVNDSEGAMVGISGADGELWIDDVKQGATFNVGLAEGQRCRLSYSLPPDEPVGSFFEAASAICEPTVQTGPTRSSVHVSN